MSIETVRAHLARHGREGDVVEFDDSSATVELAAARLGTDPAHIAKTIAFHDPADESRALLIVVAGDAKVHGGEFKRRFGGKARMIAPERLVELTGHPMGGVCPFATAPAATVWLDATLRRFDVVYPAAGTPTSAVRVEVESLESVSDAVGWVEVAAVPAG